MINIIFFFFVLPPNEYICFFSSRARVPTWSDPLNRHHVPTERSVTLSRCYTRYNVYGLKKFHPHPICYSKLKYEIIARTIIINWSFENVPGAGHSGGHTVSPRSLVPTHKRGVVMRPCAGRRKTPTTVLALGKPATSRDTCWSRWTIESSDARALVRDIWIIIIIYQFAFVTFTCGVNVTDDDRFSRVQKQ